MFKSAFGSVLVMLVSLGLAYGQAPHSHKNSPAAAPAATEPALPPDPVAMQKWFGQAVDDILTSANHAVGGRPESAR